MRLFDHDLKSVDSAVKLHNKQMSVVFLARLESSNEVSKCLQPISKNHNCSFSCTPIEFFFAFDKLKNEQTNSSI